MSIENSSLQKSVLPKKAQVGERRRNWAKERNVWVTREKLPNGKWKYLFSESADGSSLRAKEKPVGSITYRTNGRIYEKTETGWQFRGMQQGKERAQNMGRPPKFKPGEITKRKTKNGVVREFRKREDGKWDLMPMQFISKITRTPQNKTDMPKRNTNLIKDKAKRSYDPAKNPDKMKIKKEEGGQWVRINDKTIVYRTNIAS